MPQNDLYLLILYSHVSLTHFSLEYRDTEQDLMALWKKITTEIKQDGLKWGEGCNLADVAFGIKKVSAIIVLIYWYLYIIQMTLCLFDNEIYSLTFFAMCISSKIYS